MRPARDFGGQCERKTSGGRACQIEREYQQEQVQIVSVLKSLGVLHYRKLLEASPSSEQVDASAF
jgi:hypothetical protein